MLVTFQVSQQQNFLSGLNISISQEEKYHKQFIDILFQPPEELKDKYIASVPIEEPCPVTEVKTEDGEDKEKKKEGEGEEEKG